MICRRCLHLITAAHAVRVSTHADMLFDRTPRGASVHADRDICVAALRPYRNRPDVPRTRLKAVGRDEGPEK